MSNELKTVFSVGDRVVCTARHYDNLTEGKEYTIESISNCEKYYRVINNRGDSDGYYPSCFKLSTATANGVNAEGQPTYFDISQLKSWMRVTTMKGNEYVVAESNGITFYVRDGAWLKDISEAGFEPESVYEPPRNEWEFLDIRRFGKLIWKRNPEKTSEQLAQEAAKAARNVAIDSAVATIEEAEKALKNAQEKLAALKGL